MARPTASKKRPALKKCTRCKHPGGTNLCGFRLRPTGIEHTWCFDCEAASARDRYEKARARAHSGAPRTMKRDAPPAVDLMPRLVELVKRPIAFPELCDKLDLSPGKVKALVERARAEGVRVHVEHNEVSLYFPEPIDKVQKTGVAPVVGTRQQLGVISDTHLGSKYCLREQLKDCVHYLYERGVRHIVHPGDMLDGCYDHGKYELTHVGVEDQTRDFFEVLPALPGLRYHVIGGNHDQTFTDASGVDTPKFIVNYFNKRGRYDITEYGMRSAHLLINGVVVNLWHPKGGGAYAKSYNTQKKCEGYGAIKPQILLTGHYHFFDYHEDRAIQAIACPTFQGGQSAYGKTMKGAPAIGGLLLSFALTRDGTIRDFSIEKRGYYEVERPVNVMKTLDGQPVEVIDAVTESTARTVRQGRAR